MSSDENEAKKGEGQALRSQSILIPSHLTRKEFGKVYVQNLGDELRVEFTVMALDETEGWQTGLALDGSASMRGWYGRQMVNEIPDEVMKHYAEKGWAKQRVVDGRQVYALTPEATEDAKKNRYIRPMENIVQPAARELLSFLASEMDVDSHTTLIYWACGDGSAFEEIGDFGPADCRILDITGPRTVDFGNGTHLLPAMKYFVERFSSAKRAFCVFITDGSLDDLDAVKAYTTELAQDIEAGRRNFTKCVLVGVGPFIDEDQMDALDNLDTGTDVDIWDHSIYKDMRDLTDLTKELVDEDRIVADTAVIYDANENIVARFTDGMPAKVSFKMSITSPDFVLEAGGKRIKQTVEVSA